ncbi:MAG: hypothetical protein P1U89_19940 [Verrucomicrobiales bacterium]|nr:hypothetical protein [Verrucomicrobiales bacterium]
MTILPTGILSAELIEAQFRLRGSASQIEKPERSSDMSLIDRFGCLRSNDTAELSVYPTVLRQVSVTPAWWEFLSLPGVTRRLTSEFSRPENNLSNHYSE